MISNLIYRFPIEILVIICTLILLRLINLIAHEKLNEFRNKLTSTQLVREIAKVLIILLFGVYISRLWKFIFEISLNILEYDYPKIIFHPIFSSRISHIYWLAISLLAYYLLGRQGYRKTKIVCFWLIFLISVSILSTISFHYINSRKCGDERRVYYYQSRYLETKNHYYVRSKYPGFLINFSNKKYPKGKFFDMYSDYNKCFRKDGNGYHNYYLRKENQ